MSLDRQVTVRLDPDAMSFLEAFAKKAGIPHQDLVRLYLAVHSFAKKAYPGMDVLTYLLARRTRPERYKVVA